MKRVRFLFDFDFSPVSHRGRVTVAYRAGWEGPVTEPCAQQALAAKAAELLDTPAQARTGKGAPKMPAPRRESAATVKDGDNG